MNNKKKGSDFERRFCRYLGRLGFWVHFMSPDNGGNQPFDVIAVRRGNAYAIDCKTSVRKVFPLSRLEDNQVLAFQRWLDCGNTMPQIAVEYEGRVYLVPFCRLMNEEKVDLESYDFIDMEDELCEL